MKKTILIIALSFLMIPSFAPAAGNVTFLTFCNNLEFDPETMPKEVKALTISCVAFITGVTETHDKLVAEKKIEPLYCLSKRLTNGDVAAMYKDYVKTHPPEPGDSEAETLLKAMKETYPCK